MYLIDSSKLRKGDIILSKHNTRESELIRRISKSDFSHAALYVGSSSIIDSDGLGVHSKNTQRILIENPDYVRVYRLKNNFLSHEIIEKIIAFARSIIGTEYSTQEARNAIKNEKENDETNRQYCTKFVAQAYAKAGIKLVDNSKYCTPQELTNSDYLIPVEDILSKAEDKEIILAKEENTVLDKQMDITNEILEQVRNLTNKDIQNFNQLSELILDNPNFENQVIQIIDGTEYLYMWKWDVEKNPWYYNYEVFKAKIPNNQKEKLAKFLYTTEKETRKRFEDSLWVYNIYYSVNRQLFFKKMIELYEKLIELSYTREEVGRKYLKSKNKE